MSRQAIDVHQFVPALFARDAVGNHSLATQRALRRGGMGGRTWAEHRDPRLALAVRRWDRYHGSPRAAGTIVLYQASTGSEGMADGLLRMAAPLVLYYHNITPAEFFKPYDGVAAGSMRRGKRELQALAARAVLALTPTEFNATELRDLGVRDVRIVPPYYDSAVGVPNPAYLRQLYESKRGVDVLFVGRLAPHKGQLQLIRAAAALRAGLGRPVRLFLVGGEGPHTYMRAITRLIDRLGMQQSVVLTGSISQGRLAAHYQSADVFVCLSEHEGFGIPVLEAMRCGLPVIANDAAAIGETLGGAGILIGGAGPLLTAEAISRVLCDAGLREQLVRSQRRRAAALESFDRDGALLSGIREAAGR
jgi:glycosyltransferase involved in cell wall biosynthesis